MNKLLISLLIVFLSLTASQAQLYEEEDNVIVLTDANFDQVISQNQFVLVEFYAPWCGHCKNLAPHYAKAAGILKNANPAVPLAKLDATAHSKQAGKFEVKGYPTLKFFVNGQPQEYNGGRTSDEIVNWLKKKTGPVSTELASNEDLEKLISDNQVLVVYFGNANSQTYQDFLTVARGYEDIPFAHTFTQSVFDGFEVKETESIVLFKQFDEGRNDLDEGFSVENIKAFIEANQYPTIMEFDQKSAQKIFGEYHSCLFLFASETHTKEIEVFKAVAQQLKGQIFLSQTDAEEGWGKRLADYIGLSPKSQPTLRIVHPLESGETRKYSLQGEVTEQNILQFVSDFDAGKLTPELKSQEVPEQSHEEGVRVLVGKNFKEVVFDESKDVLVEFYAPWCGHCKSLAPIYAQLAQKLQSNPNVVIAKIDATENEVEGVGIQGFPTIKFWAKGKKSSPQDYNGDRTVDGFVNYLKQNGGASWSDEL